MPFTRSRRLFWSELGPDDDVLLLVEISFAGQVFRWSSRPVQIENESGDLLWFEGGLNELTFDAALQTLANSPDQNAISLDLLWPVDVAELIAKGHDLSAATGEFSAWVDGGKYADRQVFVRGRVRQPVYGAHYEPVSLTIEEAPFEDVGVWPDASARVSKSTWLTHRESDGGKVYPVIIGQPGTYRTARGNVIRGGTVPLVCESDPTDNSLASALLIAGHAVQSTSVRVYYRGAVKFSPEQGFLTHSSWGATHLDAPVEYVADRLGRLVPIVNFMTATGHPKFVDALRSATFEIVWSYTDDGGGLVDGSGLVQLAGDVMEYALKRSTLRVDWGRFNAVKPALNAWRIDCFIDESVQPWEWIADNLVPILPISMHTGDDGVFPVLWRWNASKLDAVDHIELQPGVVRTSGVTYEKQPSDISNSIKLEYAYSQSGHQRAVLHTPHPDADDLEQVTSVYSKRSALRYGVTASESYTTEVLTDEASAQKSVNWRMVADGFSHRSVTYEVPQRFAYLDLGDVVTLTDAELHTVNAVALVQGLSIGDSGRVSITLQLVENVARVEKSTGPHPDAGSADPGNYQ